MVSDGLFDMPTAKMREGRYERRVREATAKMRRAGELSPIDEVAVAGMLAAARAADAAERTQGKSWEYAVAANVRELGKLYAQVRAVAVPQTSDNDAVVAALRELGTPTVEGGA